MGCKKARGFLEHARIPEATAMIDARKSSLGRDDALKLARSVKRVVAGRGKNLVTFDMTKDPPDEETLTSYLLGPTGALKAPTLKIGDTLLVGFNKAAYEQVFGK
jgi:hypothetical protein